MRRPARLERAGALTPRDRMWAAMRAIGVNDEFTVAEIMALSEQRADTVLCYARALVLSGHLKGGSARSLAAYTVRRELERFRLVNDCGAHAPRIDKHGKPVTQGCGRDQMWRSLRILKLFTCRELAQAASTEEHAVAHDEAKTYVRFLAMAGYLVLLCTGNRAHEAQYAFVKSRDTGPRAPLVTREKNVIDGNTGEEFKL